MAMLTRPTTGLIVETFRAQEGCLGHLVLDEVSRTALAIDPRLDQVDAYLAAVRSRNVRLAFVLDTHTHADHLSGVRRLAARTGAAVLAHATAPLAGAARRLRGGDAFELGSLPALVIDARGHTPDSLAILVDGHLFTGDALLVGGAGLTDFMGGSAADLFDTFRRFEALPDATVVHPGHDYAGRPVSTIAEEKVDNPLFRELDRAALASQLSAAAAPPPANMDAILRHNSGEADTVMIAARDAEALWREGPSLLLLDVRSALEAGEHIEGARNIPLEELEARLDELPQGADVIVTCRSGVRVLTAVETLRRAGRWSRVLEGGMNAWRRAGLPVRQGRKRLPVDRQVQLVAGLMVLVGTALGAFVNTWLLAIAAFFGAGLTFAGATGTCGLARLLMTMPWNRIATMPSGNGPAACATPAAPASCAAPSRRTPG